MEILNPTTLVSLYVRLYAYISIPPDNKGKTMQYSCILIDDKLERKNSIILKEKQQCTMVGSHRHSWRCCCHHRYRHSLPEVRSQCWTVSYFLPLRGWTDPVPAVLLLLLPGCCYYCRDPRSHKLFFASYDESGLGSGLEHYHTSGGGLTGRTAGALLDSFL